jgi:hypothetical protein
LMWTNFWRYWRIPRRHLRISCIRAEIWTRNFPVTEQGFSWCEQISGGTEEYHEDTSGYPVSGPSLNAKFPGYWSGVQLMWTNFWRYWRIPRRHLRISGLRAEFERETSWLLIRGSVDVNKFLIHAIVIFFVGLMI